MRDQLQPHGEPLPEIPIALSIVRPDNRASGPLDLEWCDRKTVLKLAQYEKARNEPDNIV